jgi:hypothetical protein
MFSQISLHKECVSCKVADREEEEEEVLEALQQALEEDKLLCVVGVRCRM